MEKDFVKNDDSSEADGAPAGDFSRPLCSAISLNDFQKEMNKLNEWAKHGCSNHGCMIEPPKGMGTNSICCCRPGAFAAHLLDLACKLERHGKYGRWPNIALVEPDKK